MPRDAKRHLWLAVENHPGDSDGFPFAVSRSGQNALRIVSNASRMGNDQRDDIAVFACAIPLKIKGSSDNGPVGKAALDCNDFLLHVSESLIRGVNGEVPQTAMDLPLNVSDAVVSELAFALMDTHQSKKRSPFTTACMIKMLCARLRYVQTANEDPNSTGFEGWQLLALREALDNSTDHCISVSQVARICRLSVCHFSRLFKATFGMPLHRYRVNQRIRVAKTRLVESNEPISRIALDCGFADQSSFTRRFTAITGVSPGMWRRQAGRSHNASRSGMLSKFGGTSVQVVQ